MQLRVLRIIWFALLLGQVMFLIVATTFAASPDQRDEGLVLFYVAVGMLVVLTPIAFLVRGQIYARGRGPDGRVAGGAYATGNIIFWAMFEGVGMLSIVGALLNGGRGPHLFVTAAALAMHVVNFPTGRPMRGDDDALRPMDRR
jgi:hypothetical protein